MFTLEKKKISKLMSQTSSFRSWKAGEEKERVEISKKKENINIFKAKSRFFEKTNKIVKSLT